MLAVKINKTDLLYWLNKYSDNETIEQKTVEQKLTKSFQEKGFADKKEMVELLNWKFETTMKPRLKRELNLIEKIPEEQIIEKTTNAFKIQNEEYKIEILKSIKGVGNAVCSVVLTFQNPNRYGVFDIHAWRELFGKEDKNYYFTTKALIQFFERLRCISNDTGLTCRDVEKAIFTKNCVEHKTIDRPSRKNQNTLLVFPQP